MESLEKRILIFSIFILLFFNINLNAQNHLQQEKSLDNDLRFPLWALIDEVPSLEYKHDDTKQFYNFSVERLKELAPFVLEGMVYGWTFTYTPYDKRRNVPEYFEYHCVKAFDVEKKYIHYDEPWFQDNKLNVWVRFERKPELMEIIHSWESINYPKIKGTGKGKLVEGVEGIHKAYGDALKNAVRSYAQGLTKNKPKEISGTVLLCDLPRLYVQSGRYCADLEFYLKIDKIRNYSNY